MKFMVIGASRGLGRAFVEGLCSAGDTVIGVSRSRPRDLECPEGVTLQWIEADLSQPTLAANHIAAQAPADLDVLIHNLGIWEETAFSDEYAFLDESDAALTQLVDVNVTATLVLLQRLLPRVLGAPRPQLVLTGSTSALPRSGRPEVAFGASKFALNGVADALREGFRDRRLAVTSLQLGCLNTDDALSVPVAEAGHRRPALLTAEASARGPWWPLGRLWFTLLLTGRRSQAGTCYGCAFTGLGPGPGQRPAQPAAVPAAGHRSDRHDRGAADRHPPCRPCH